MGSLENPTSYTVVKSEIFWDTQAGVMFSRGTKGVTLVRKNMSTYSLTKLLLALILAFTPTFQDRPQISRKSF